MMEERGEPRKCVGFSLDVSLAFWDIPLSSLRHPCFNCVPWNWVALLGKGVEQNKRIVTFKPMVCAVKFD